jgi:hypothetical protein
LRVSFFTPVNVVPCRSLVGLLVGLRLFSSTRRRALRCLDDAITRQITRQIGHPLVCGFSHSFRLAFVLLPFYTSKFSSIAFPAIRSLFFSNRVGLHIGLFVGFLAELLVSFHTLVDDIRAGSLFGLFAGLRVSFMTPIDGFPIGSLVGLVVGLYVSFVAPVDVFPGGSLVGLHIGLRVSFVAPVDGFPCTSLVGLLVRLRIAFLTPVDGFPSS